MIHPEARGQGVPCDLSAFASLPTRVLLLHDRTLHDITADYLTDKDLARAYAQHRPRNQT